MSDYKKLEKCLCCGCKDLEIALDLGNQPLANSYLKNKDEVENCYPLAVNFCYNCTHIQLTHSVNPDLLFKNYLYVSGTTKTLKDYFNWFVGFTQNYTDGKKVLDIACNDGSQLDAFKSHGYLTYGIDPAENLYELSSKNHQVICDYLNKGNVKNFNVKFDKIIAQNVFAHNDYPLDFLLSCKDVLEDNGAIFIQTSQADMVKNNQFDTIYHEHISFFSVKSFSALVKRAGLNLIDVVRTPVHGTSFVFVVSKDRPDRTNELLKNEFVIDDNVIQDYTIKCNEVADKTAVMVQNLREEGFTIIGYGAAAKGNTFLNFSKIKLDYIVDDNPLKVSLLTPGSRIPIFSPSKLVEDDYKKCIIPLAWNFFDEIKNRVENQNVKKAIFLRYFPELVIC